MELREIYEIVRAHLLKQMERAIDGGVCAYRGDRGLKCAIGCLIPDTVYTSEMEGDIEEMLLHWPNHPFEDDQIPFLEELQAIHDRVEPMHWRYKLDELAMKWSL